MKKVLFVFLTFVCVSFANACDNPTNVSHPSKLTQGHPDQTLWEIALGHAMREAGLTPGLIHCIRYNDGVREKAQLIVTSQWVSGKPVPGTRVPANTSTGGAGGQSCAGSVSYVTFYLTTIWYLPSTGEIVDITSVPFEVPIYEGCSYWMET